MVEWIWWISFRDFLCEMIVSVRENQRKIDPHPMSRDAVSNLIFISVYTFQEWEWMRYKWHSVKLSGGKISSFLRSLISTSTRDSSARRERESAATMRIFSFHIGYKNTIITRLRVSLDLSLTQLSATCNCVTEEPFVCWLTCRAEFIFLLSRLSSV